MKTPQQKAAEAAKHRERYAANPELYKQRNRDHYTAHREKLLADAKAYYQTNRDAVRAARAERKARDPEAWRARGRELYAKNRERRRESNRRWHERNPNKANAARHGMTVEQFDALLEEQRGACALCLGAFKQKPYIDHDHTTGEVRGLLCFHCNTALGHFRDDPCLMRRAADYVQWRPLREETQERAPIVKGVVELVEAA